MVEHIRKMVKYERWMIAIMFGIGALGYCLLYYDIKSDINDLHTDLAALATLVMQNAAERLTDPLK